MSTQRIPLFPLNTVLFPGGLLPLRVFEARYMDMTRDCMKNGSPFGVCLIREGREVGTPATPEAIGCLAQITDWDMQQLGLLQLKTKGGQRFRVEDYESAPNGLVSAAVDLIAAEAPLQLPNEFEACARLLRLVVKDQGDQLFEPPHRFDDAVWVSYRLSEILPVPMQARQKLLELTDTLARLAILQQFLAQRDVSSG
jgi:hypothetical protein